MVFVSWCLVSRVVVLKVKRRVRVPEKHAGECSL